MSTLEEISKLKVGSAAEKLAILQTLDGRNSSADLQLMFEALSDPKWIVRKKACDMLGACGPVILEPLSRLLAAGSEDQKFWTVKALVALGKDAVPVLVNALTRGGKTSRIYAASALGEIGDPVAIPYLTQSLADATWRVRRNGYESLVKFGDAAFKDLQKGLASKNEDMVFWSARALGKLGEKSREVLLRGLKEGSSQLKFILAAALGETGDARIISVLIKNLRDGNWIVQKRSADALVEVGEKALPALEEAFLKSQSPQDYWLVLALARIRPRGIKVLEQAFIHQGETFRWEHKDALARIGEPLLPLYEVLAGHEAQGVRFFTVSCLGELKGTRQADDLLLRFLADGSWSVRKLAADFLSDRGPVLLDRLNLALETGDEDLRYWVTYIFQKMGDPGLAYLVKALGDPNKNISYFAASALGEVRQPEAVHPLIRALGDSTWSVRKNASESLVRLQEFSVPHLVHHANDEDEDVQYWVVKTLRNIGASAIPDAVKMLQKGSNEQRCLSARVLGELRDPMAREALAQALQDGHEWVRQYAALALAALGDARAVTHFIGCFQDATFQLHAGVLDVFARFGTACLPELEPVLKAGKVTGLRNALRVLGRIAAPDSFEVVRGYLDHRSDDVKVAAVEAISAYRDRPETIALLSPLLQSPATRVRSRVYLTLAESGSDEGVAEVLKAMFLNDDQKEVRRVTEVLLRLGEKILPTLMGMLGSSRVALRKAAADFLIDHLGHRARPAVEKALASDDKNIRFWANKVLKVLNEREVVP